MMWYEVPAECWLVPVAEPPSPADLAEIPWRLEEDVIRRVARKEGMLLERLGKDRYRLWDLRGFVRGYSLPVPEDLTTTGEYVDQLAGIAVFLFYALS